MGKKMFTKRTLPMALAAVLAISPMQVMAASNDLNGHWAEKVITEWQDKGLIKGYADGSFKPNNNVTRAEFVIMMNNALGFEDAEDISFGDVKPGDWYYNAVAKAVAAGYSKGYADGTFKPGATITRAEAAVMIANAAGLEADETGAEGFTDAYAIPSWAKGSIGAAVNAGFMSGYTDGSFGAAKSITRAEAVSSLNRVMGGVVVEEVTEEVVAEDMTVTEDDTIVEDGVINGDLIIDEAVGEGEVYLNDLVVKGDIIVNGGGDDSIYLKNVEVKGKIRINKKGVRVHMSGDTKVPHMEVHEVSEITSENFEGEVGTITIIGDLGTGTRVTVDVPADAVVIEGKSSVAINADVANVTIGEDAEGAKLEIGKNATVDTVTADAKANITGTGKVENLEANASGITVNKNLDVDKTETASGVSKPTTSGSSSGGGGSSSGGSNRPSTPDTPDDGTGDDTGSGEGGGNTGGDDEGGDATTDVSVALSTASATVEEGAGSFETDIKLNLTNATVKESGNHIVPDGETAEDCSVFFDGSAGNNYFVLCMGNKELAAGTYTYTFTIPADALTVKSGYSIPASGLKVTFTLTVEEEAYTVNVDENITGGTVTATPANAKEGDTVTLKAEPKEGYKFTGWIVKDASDKDVTVTDNTFTMPAGAVDVSATFEGIELTDYEALTAVEIKENKQLTTADAVAERGGLPETVTLKYDGGTVDATITGWTYVGIDEYAPETTDKAYTFKATYKLPEGTGYKQPATPIEVTVDVTLKTAQTAAELTGFEVISYTITGDQHLLTDADIEDAVMAVEELKTVTLTYGENGTVDAEVTYWEYAGTKADANAEYNPKDTAAEYQFTADYTLPDGYTQPSEGDIVVTATVKLGVVQTVDTTEIDEAIAAAEAAKEGVAVTAETDKDKLGFDIADGTEWVTQAAVDTLDEAIAAAEAAKSTVANTTEVQAAVSTLEGAVDTFNSAKTTAEVDVTDLNDLITTVKDAYLDVYESADGEDITTDLEWVTPEVMTAIKDAVTKAEQERSVLARTQNSINAAKETLNTEFETFEAAKKPGTLALKVITGVKALEDVTIPFGTEGELDLNRALPQEVELIIDGSGETKTVSVYGDWVCDNYDANEEGTYTFTATVEVPVGYTYNGTLTATVKGIVEKEEIEVEGKADVVLTATVDATEIEQTLIAFVFGATNINEDKITVESVDNSTGLSAQVTLQDQGLYVSMSGKAVAGTATFTITFEEGAFTPESGYKEATSYEEITFTVTVTDSESGEEEPTE